MQLRESNIDKLPQTTYDVLIIGGGINGAVSAAALAGKGLKTALIDRGDFAGQTSMHSSNLAWGGIKYMETYDFALVRKLCKSRNHLIKSYPSTVQEIRFFTTIGKGFRYHPIYLWAGTWLYWFFGNCFTRIPRLFSRKGIRQEESIINTDDSIGGFEYSDAYLHDNDARFVFNFIRTALNRGCVAANYVESLGARRDNGLWTVQARDVINDRTFDISARIVVNACGPYVDQHNGLTGQQTEHRHAFSKGIHLIVDRLTPNRRVLAFFADDGRLFFVIPMGARTCIGTTDTPVKDADVQVTEEDIRFVLDNINKRLTLETPLVEDDIIATRCGVRPLAIQTEGGKGRDFLQLSRKHAIDSDQAQAHLSIFGGKLTDCLNVGNEVCDIVKDMGVSMEYPNYKWYGEPHEALKEEFFHQARLMDLDSYTAPESSEKLSTRLWRRYALEAIGLLENIREDPRQAEILIQGTEYTRCEIQQAAHREMITKLEDFLRRRSKIALVVRQDDIRKSPGLLEACQILFGDQAQAKFDEYFENQPTTPAGHPPLDSPATAFLKD
ncbi:glycerol-3-phosphate dehydrogenase/oxidase [Granulosicoccus antarcticus]|uniref:Aerobic glycerol-3-phosphate dehydrogenase n=1 Tax=Granulosicoccus antarcticus IMCC3135 TaxID=1192854 RepID=A0A2Z2NWW7_9GAMM|nr:glycerol-3-phosphate dehydrogenase/oxidase [Granulosicoccus antarcticus]ASJ75733.1 Aerobic glycerol-3-phosphate dehydrogenase [Granulosicoccus antarcticus IMCC3135]